jgi:hypothetical protein
MVGYEMWLKDSRSIMLMLNATRSMESPMVSIFEFGKDP